MYYRIVYYISGLLGAVPGRAQLGHGEVQPAAGVLGIQDVARHESVVEADSKLLLKLYLYTHSPIYYTPSPNFS